MEAGTVEWSSESEMGEEEEPLFADDLQDSLPLPPPLPSQMQNSNSSQAGGDPAPASGLDGGGSAANGNQPAGTQNTNDQGPPQKKRKPLLTLKMDRIFSEKGLPYLEAEFPKLKFRGRTHEHADLKFLLQQYEHWANRLYPKFTFKDVTHRIEKLSNTNEFKTQLAVIRYRHAHRGAASPPLSDDSSDEGPPPANNHATTAAETEGSNTLAAGEEEGTSDDGRCSDIERGSTEDGDITNGRDGSVNIVREYRSNSQVRESSDRGRDHSIRGRDGSEDGDIRECRSSSDGDRSGSEDREISGRGWDHSIRGKDGSKDEDIRDDSIRECRSSSDGDRSGSEDREISGRGRDNSKDGDITNGRDDLIRECRSSSDEDRGSSEDREISERGRDNLINPKKRGNLKRRNMEEVSRDISDRISSGNYQEGLDKESFLRDGAAHQGQ